VSSLNTVQVKLSDESKSLYIDETLTSGSSYRVVVENGAEEVGKGSLILMLPAPCHGNMVVASCSLEHGSSDGSGDISGVINLSTEPMMRIAMDRPFGVVSLRAFIHSDTMSQNVADGTVSVKLIPFGSSEADGSPLQFKGDKGDRGPKGDKGDKGDAGQPSALKYAYDAAGKAYAVEVRDGTLGKTLALSQEGVSMNTAAIMGVTTLTRRRVAAVLEKNFPGVVELKNNLNSTYGIDISYFHPSSAYSMTVGSTSKLFIFHSCIFPAGSSTPSSQRNITPVTVYNIDNEYSFEGYYVLMDSMSNQGACTGIDESGNIHVYIRGTDPSTSNVRIADYNLGSANYGDTISDRTFVGPASVGAKYVDRRNGRWMVESAGYTSAWQTPEMFNVYDAEFNSVAEAFFPKFHFDTFKEYDNPNDKVGNSIPKIQGVRMADDSFILFKGGSVAYGQYKMTDHGVVRYYFDGRVVDTLCESQKLMDALGAALGQTVVRIENESGFVDDNGNVFGIHVIRYSGVSGDKIAIIQEFANSADSFDCAKAIRPQGTVPRLCLSDFNLPLNGSGDFVNPFTDEKINSVNAMVKMMADFGIDRMTVSLNTSNVAYNSLAVYGENDDGSGAPLRKVNFAGNPDNTAGAAWSANTLLCFRRCNHLKIFMQVFTEGHLEKTASRTYVITLNNNHVPKRVRMPAEVSSVISLTDNRDLGYSQDDQPDPPVLLFDGSSTGAIESTSAASTTPVTVVGLTKLNGRDIAHIGPISSAKCAPTSVRLTAGKSAGGNGGDASDYSKNLVQFAVGYLGDNRAVYPVPDGAVDLGGYSSDDNGVTVKNRWRSIYLVNSPQIISDAREKELISEIPDEVLDAWGSVEFRRYCLRSERDKSSNPGRLHAGVIAQQVVRMFDLHGIDPFQYGIVTRHGEGIDGWYSVCYAEALVLEAAYQRRRADLLESRIARIESMMEA